MLVFMPEPDCVASELARRDFLGEALPHLCALLSSWLPQFKPMNPTGGFQQQPERLLAERLEARRDYNRDKT